MFCNILEYCEHERITEKQKIYLSFSKICIKNHENMKCIITMLCLVFSKYNINPNKEYDSKLNPETRKKGRT